MGTIIGTILQSTAQRVRDGLIRPLSVRPFVGYEELTRTERRTIRQLVGGTYDRTEKVIPIGVPVDLSSKVRDSDRSSGEHVVSMTGDTVVGEGGIWFSDRLVGQLIRPKGTKIGHPAFQISVGLDDTIDDITEPDSTYDLVDPRESFKVGPLFHSFITFDVSTLQADLSGLGKTLSNLQSVSMRATVVSVPEVNMKTKVIAAGSTYDPTDPEANLEEIYGRLDHEDAVVEDVLFGSAGVQTEEIEQGSSGPLKAVIESSMSAIAEEDRIFHLAMGGEVGDECPEGSFLSLEDALVSRPVLLLDLGDDDVLEVFAVNDEASVGFVIEEVEPEESENPTIITLDDFSTDAFLERWIATFEPWNIGNVIESGLFPCHATVERDEETKKEGVSSMKVTIPSFRNDGFVFLFRALSGESFEGMNEISTRTVFTAWVKNPARGDRSFGNVFVIENMSLDVADPPPPVMSLSFDYGEEDVSFPKQLNIDGIALETDDDGWTLYGFPLVEAYSPQAPMSFLIDDVGEVGEYISGLSFGFVSGLMPGSELWVDKVRVWELSDVPGALAAYLYEYTGDGGFPEKGESLPVGPLDPEGPWSVVDPDGKTDSSGYETGVENLPKFHRSVFLKQSLGRTHVEIPMVWGEAPEQFRSGEYEGEGDPVDPDKVYALVIAGVVWKGYKVGFVGFNRDSGVDDDSRTLVSEDVGQTIVEVGTGLSGTACLDMSYRVFDKDVVFDHIESWLELMQTGPVSSMADFGWYMRRMGLSMMIGSGGDEFGGSTESVMASVLESLRNPPVVEFRIVAPDGKVIHSEETTVNLSSVFFPMKDETAIPGSDALQRAGLPIHCPAGSVIHLRVKSLGSRFRRLGLFEWRCRTGIRFDDTYPNE